jgi:hypothetical protein
MNQERFAAMGDPDFRSALRAMTRAEWIALAYKLVFDFLSFPLVIVSCFINPIHPYRMTWPKRIGLALRLYLNGFRILTLVSYRAQLMMAVKLLEIPPEVEGGSLNAGLSPGGTTAALSLACAITGRRLIVYDSFEGLPVPAPGERMAGPGEVGRLCGPLDVVRKNVAKCGRLEVCTFRKGWFADTLPGHTEPIVLAFLDVDYEASLYDCVINLWPHLVAYGLVFVDEYVDLNYCALFFSEAFWSSHFGERPPGLLGAGSGVGLGQYYWGPFLATPPLQQGGSTSYTWKGNSAFWTYAPTLGNDLSD